MTTPLTLSAKLDRDTFLVNQKHRAWMKSKYYVFDQDGQPLLYVERPVRPLRRSDITVFDDDTCTTPLLIIRQDHGYAALARTYTLLEPGSEEPLAHFRRDNIKSLFRRAWAITDASGTPIAYAREDSTAIAIVRRLLEFVPYVGSIVGLVRTNFQLSVASVDGVEAHVGAFNRKLSIG
ncbi:MAG TPA: hypothetical protein VIE40_07425, partial [Dehalococcoidia bacterium]